ncbi:hypothetical protein [Curtobacterium sp. 'Ferrero']|uniref:hypothetical protein n=1 Tax=Curtobacterium sp. 'Ferrero' TaxID=2033654 RepID=UPI0011442C19|nr:hypothetical protein [Curtobacterium sp. 'Ferrero']
MDGSDERTAWWRSTDERAFLAWLADRSTAPVRHLAPVLRVGRTRQGVLVAELLRPAGERLADALDRLGVPTVGVAVTLTLPLLELAVAAARGAVVLGTATVDDVVVDDSGAVVLCDRPDGAALLCDRPDGAAPLCDRPDGAAPLSDRPGGAVLLSDRPGAAVLLSGPSDAAVLLPSRHGSVGQRRERHRGRGSGTLLRGGALDGIAVLVLAARTVWERVDPREACRPSIDQAVAAARAGGPDELDLLLRTVRDAAPPRPVRWEPEPTEYHFRAAPGPTDAAGEPGTVDRVVDVLRQVVEHGVPLAGRRIPLRQAAVGVVVAVGLVTAATFALGS